MAILVNLPQWILEMDNGDKYITLMSHNTINSLVDKVPDKRYTLVTLNQDNPVLFTDEIKEEDYYKYLLIYDNLKDIILFKALG